MARLAVALLLLCCLAATAFGALYDKKRGFQVGVTAPLPRPLFRGEIREASARRLPAAGESSHA